MFIKNLQDLIDNNIVKFYVKKGCWTGILRENKGIYYIDCYEPESDKFVRTFNPSLQDHLDWDIKIIEKCLTIKLFGTHGTGKSFGVAYMSSKYLDKI